MCCVLQHRTLLPLPQCFDSPGGQPEQRVCVFEDLVMYNGKLYYVTNGESWRSACRRACLARGWTLIHMVKYEDC